MSCACWRPVCGASAITLAVDDEPAEHEAGLEQRPGAEHEGHGGAVTLIQRFGSAANLNIHPHCLVLVEEMGQTYLAEPDAHADEARTLRPLQAASVTYCIAFGPRAEQKVLTLRGAMPREGTARQPLCVDIDGFSLHAAVELPAYRIFDGTYANLADATLLQRQGAIAAQWARKAVEAVPARSY